MSSLSYADGFGRRSGPALGGDPRIETLRLCDELSQAEGVEEALRERVTRLAGFEHPGFAPARAVERDRGAIVLRSDAVPGTRLAEILKAAERHWLDADAPFAFGVLRQVAASIAALHEQGRHLKHGTVGPERIVLRPDGAAILVEAALGAVVEQVEPSRTQLWKQFRVPIPPVAGSSSLDQVTDVMQLGVLALALARGRLLGRDDFPARLPALLQEIAGADPLGHRSPVPRALRAWISRALQLDSRAAFRSGPEAEAALSWALSDAGIGSVPPQHLADWAAAALAGQMPPVLAAPAPAGPAAAAADLPPVVHAAACVAAPAVEAPPLDLPMQPSPPPPPAVAVPRRPTTGARPVRRKRVWPLAARVLRVSAVAAGLLLVWSVAYLGARSYLGFPSLLFPTGQLVVESQPAGLEVLLNGRPKGVTPVALDVRPGRYTLALRSSRSTTLVPITVEAHASHTERIQVRRGRPPLRTSSVRRGK